MRIMIHNKKDYMEYKNKNKLKGVNMSEEKEDRLDKIEEDIKGIVGSINNLAKAITKNGPDLNGNGTTTKTEENIYSFFKEVVSKTQKNSVVAQAINVGFLLLSFGLCAYAFLT